MYILKLRLKAKFERINCVAMKLFVKYLRKVKLRTSKSETEGRKTNAKAFNTWSQCSWGAHQNFLPKY